MQNLLKQLSFLIILLCFQVGCGRKQKNIFVFNEKKPSHKISKLELPSVHGLRITKIKNQSKLLWQSINLTNKFYQLCGYNIYRFTTQSFIPRKPLNKKPVKQTYFIDASTNNSLPYYYFVRGLFKINENLLEGPSSIIVSQ
jgi:hypothetical protein